jgi:hypothetical protein
MSAPDTRFLLEPTPASPAKSSASHTNILNLTTKLSADGTHNWEAPAGRWEILRIGHTATGARVSTESEGWGGHVIDLLSPAALDSYWNTNISPMFKALGPHAGTTLKYVHTDSWEGGGMNWTPGFDRVFPERRGYDPIPWLAVLAGHIIGSRAESDAFLADFRKTIGDLVADHFTNLSKALGRVWHGYPPGMFRSTRQPARWTEKLRAQRVDDVRVLVAIAASARCRQPVLRESRRSSAALDLWQASSSGPFTTIPPHWKHTRSARTLPGHHPKNHHQSHESHSLSHPPFRVHRA